MLSEVKHLKSFRDECSIERPEILRFAQNDSCDVQLRLASDSSVACFDKRD
jgi:hypothetical protein